MTEIFCKDILLVGYFVKMYSNICNQSSILLRGFVICLIQLLIHLIIIHTPKLQLLSTPLIGPSRI